MTENPNVRQDEDPDATDGVEGLDEATLEALPAPDPDEPVDRADVIGAGARSLAAWCGRLLLVAGAVVVLGWVAGKLWSAILPVVLALLVTSVLWPLVSWLKRVGVPYSLGAIISLVGGIGIVVGLVTAIAPSFVKQWPQLWSQALAGVNQLQAWAAGPPLNMRDEQLTQWINQAVAYLQSHSGELLSQALSFGGSIGSGAVTLLLTLVLSFFFLKDGPKFLPAARRVVGRRAGFHASELLVRLWRTLSGYISTQAIVSFVDAVFIGLGVALLGVPLALPITVLTFLAGFIPIVGAVSAGTLAVLVALVSNGLTTALLTLGVVLLVQQLEGNILQPLLQSRVMQLHPVVVLLAVVLGGGWAGIIGAFLAVPVAASLAVLFRYLGDLIDLRTGDREPTEVAWATDDGHHVATQSMASAALFRALVRKRSRDTVQAATETEEERASWRDRLLGRYNK
ncbi:MAG: AI-2E family transporter [Arachnia sp.]